MARTHTWLAISLLSLVSVGCVSTEKYHAAQMDATNTPRAWPRSSAKKAKPSPLATCFRIN